MQTTLDYSFTEFPAFKDKDVEIHKGTGNHAYDPWLVQWWTVNDVSKPLGFQLKHCEVVVMCLTIRTSDAPDWYGIAFRRGIRSFSSVNVFFHPSPGNAGMTDDAYKSRTGLWPALFRYAQNLGFQLDAGGCDQVLVIPFFNNASYSTGGIFAPRWKEIVAVALSGAQRAASSMGGKTWSADVEKGSSLSPEASDVVLSCFSFGRQSMQSVRQRMPGLNTCLREIWDFDGTGPGRPTSDGKVKVISYDQQDSMIPTAFHVPLRRWSGFSPVKIKDPHGFIPNMLMWHAAEVSDVANTHKK